MLVIARIAGAFALLVLFVMSSHAAAAADARRKAPNTRITKGPKTGSKSSSATASFSFKSTRKRSTFRCSLDGARFRRCISPATYSGLTSGRHTFRVRAVRGRRADRSPARRTWAVALSHSAAAPAESTSGPAVSPALTVSGNKIMRNGRPFHFYGVNRDSLEWGRDNWGGCGGDGHFTDADFDRIAAWNATAVRFPLAQANWLGRRCDAEAYKAMVDAAIAKANARGMEAILDLHWSDVEGRAPCDAGCRSGQQPMPDADSIAFWRDVARRYANWERVTFNLYNEPHGVSWDCWRSGGCTVRSATTDAFGQTVSYTAVGMQQLYDAVRSEGARNLVLIGGLDWAYDLSGVSSGYAILGENIAYDTHVYVRWHNTTSDWDAHFGELTATHPVTATEFGSTDCSSDDTAALLRYFEAPGGRPSGRISWTGWSWNDPGSCSQPSLIADWSGTPLAGQGQVVHDALAAARP